MSLTEQEIIAEITLGQAKAPKPYGVGDDGGINRRREVVVHDTMIENIHFDDRLSPSDVGWKIVAVNVSDVAAMGRLPDWATLSLSVPNSIEKQWVTDFAKGLRKGLKEWNVQLLGGDTTRSSGPIVVSMAMGSRGGHDVVWRSGAAIGNVVWVTGTLGNAAYGFYNPDSTLGLQRLQRPQPPAHFIAALASLGIVTAMTDISDGLNVDLHHLCAASKVGAVIQTDAIPKGNELWQEKKALQYATSFGEDYEMLFTTFPGASEIVKQTARRYKTKVTAIGQIVTDPNRVVLHNADWPSPLFTHFS